MHLVDDLNGNHVTQKCLSNFGAEENKAEYSIWYGFPINNVCTQRCVDGSLPQKALGIFRRPSHNFCNSPFCTSVHGLKWSLASPRLVIEAVLYWCGTGECNAQCSSLEKQPKCLRKRRTYEARIYQHANCTVQVPAILLQ